VKSPHRRWVFLSQWCDSNALASSLKMIDYRRSAADDFNLSIFSGTSHRILPFLVELFWPLKPERLWIVGGLSAARQTYLLVRSSYQCRPGSSSK
jgi:hypothetical protein